MIIATLIFVGLIFSAGLTVVLRLLLVYKPPFCGFTFGTVFTIYGCLCLLMQQFYPIF